MTESNAITPKKTKNIADVVLARVQEKERGGELTIPKDYSPENALSAAYLKIRQTKNKSGVPADKCCTPESAANALMDMVVQGLSPGRNQCYFIVYGKELTLQRSYKGTVAAAKRFSEVSDVFAQVVYEADDFAYRINPKTGVKEVTKHEQKLENTAGKIVAAYATVLREGREPYQEIMTIDQIKKAWNQGATKGSSPAHKNFPEEMAKKTVINRAVKLFVDTATDQEILADAFNRTTENDYRKEEPLTADVEEVKDADLAAIFGDGGEFGSEVDQEDQAKGKSPQIDDVELVDDPNALTEEEKAEILAQEAQEAAE